MTSPIAPFSLPSSPKASADFPAPPVTGEALLRAFVCYVLMQEGAMTRRMIHARARALEQALLAWPEYVGGSFYFDIVHGYSPLLDDVLFTLWVDRQIERSATNSERLQSHIRPVYANHIYAGLQENRQTYLALFSEILARDEATLVWPMAVVEW